MLDLVAVITAGFALCLVVLLRSTMSGLVLGSVSHNIKTNFSEGQRSKSLTS